MEIIGCWHLISCKQKKSALTESKNDENPFSIQEFNPLTFQENIFKINHPLKIFDSDELLKVSNSPKTICTNLY